MRLRKPQILVMLLAVVLFAGCDSGDDGLSDSERFVGSWTVTSVRDQEGDKTPVISALGTLSATFDDDGQYELTFDWAQQGLPDQTLSNTYTVNEAADKLVLNATDPLDGSLLPLAVSYDFETDDRVTLSVPSAVIMIVATQFPAFGQLRGDVSLTLSRQN